MNRAPHIMASVAMLLAAAGCGGSSGSETTNGAAAAPATSSTGGGAAVGRGAYGSAATSAPATAAAGATTAATAAAGESSGSVPAATTSDSSPTVAPSGTATASTTGSVSRTVVSTKQTKLGPILAGPQGMTLYLWVADRGGRSVCTDACAQFWPPLLTKDAPQATGVAKGADLGTTKRADGTTQVTYAGHPLYFFAKDKDRGDRYGQGSNGFGAPWYVVGPDGQAIRGGS